MNECARTHAPQSAVIPRIIILRWYHDIHINPDNLHQAAWFSLTPEPDSQTNRRTKKEEEEKNVEKKEHLKS